MSRINVNELIRTLQLGFDLLCAIAGLAVLLLLGPALLLSGAQLAVPRVQALTRIEATLLDCREVFGASELILQGSATLFQSQSGSCIDLQDHLPHVAIFIPAHSGSSGHSARISSYGLSVGDAVVRQPQTDIDATRIDRAFRMILGTLATAALAGFLIASAPTRGNLPLLLMGDARASDAR